MASHAVEIEDSVICVFLPVPSWTYRLLKTQRWDRPDAKSEDYKFNVTKRPYMRGHVEGRYDLDKATGKLKFNTGGNILTGAGATGGESGAIWKGFDPSAKRRHWAVPGYLAEQMPESFLKLGVLQKLDALYDAGLIEITEGNAWPVPVKYLESTDGQPLQDLWTAQPYTEHTVHGTDEIIDADVQWLGTTAPERLGYPTQKPLGLLERIIRSSSSEGDVVLDPFCGCGTAVHAAQKLARRWIGIDITHLAISLIEKRLRDAFPYLRPASAAGIKQVAEPAPQDYLARFEVHGTPKDIESARDLATRDKYQFQWWACSLVNAQPFQGKKKGADGGIDGLIFFQDEKAGAKKIVVSVKGGDNVNVAMMRDFAHVIDREKASVGLFVTLAEPSKPMMKEAISLGFYDSPLGKKYQKLQILTIENLLSGTQRAEYPDLAMGAHTFKKAKTEGGDSEQKGLF